MSHRKPHSLDSRSTHQRRAFEQINASWAIEGLEPDEEMLEVQERIISGQLTHQQAITEMKSRYGALRSE